MASVKYQSRIKERNSEGTTNSIVYYGAREEMLELQGMHPINEYAEEGRLKSNRVYQGEGAKIWYCELRYETDNDGEYANAPDTTFGKKSAQLRGSTLSMPLEAHRDYRTNWNYFLAAAPDVNASPSWWLDATDTIISADDSQKYRWVKSPSECPNDKKGLWRVILEPTMPGVESYDLATYTITETARFHSAAAAGKMVANTLNKIGVPSNTFGIKGGNWKCDDAGVSWSGKYWLATLSWTRSGDEQGWNSKLYS